MEWDFLAVSNSFTSDAEMDARQTGKPRGLVAEYDEPTKIRVWAKTWGQIIQEAEGRLTFYRRRLEYQANEPEALKYLKSINANYLSDEVKAKIAALDAEAAEQELTAMADPPEPSFGPAWRGWERHNQFAQSVKTDLRYVRSIPTGEFLEHVQNSCASRVRTIPSDRVFWRARVGCDSHLIERDDHAPPYSYEEDAPFGAKDMKPITNWQSEGRADPRGIPCLYTATTRDTALAEVRPWIGATITVSQLKTNRALSLIDWSLNHKSDSFLKVLDPGMSHEDGIWIAIDQAFAKPVSKDDESKEYIPTQIMAELFKSTGYDGIVYKSLLSDDGFNVAFFNLDIADVINGSLYKAKSMKFDFDETGASTWFAKQK